MCLLSVISACYEQMHFLGADVHQFLAQSCLYSPQKPEELCMLSTGRFLRRVAFHRAAHSSVDKLKSEFSCLFVFFFPEEGVGCWIMITQSSNSMVGMMEDVECRDTAQDL